MLSDIKYSSNSRNDVLCQLDKVHGSCLEIGSGDGRFAREILSKFPIGLYHAFEPAGTHDKSDQDSRLVVFDSYFTESSEVYDFIFLNDVLEHMEDPASFLKRLQINMHKDSKIVISVPNFRNIQIITRLLYGNLRYEDLGIMDKTHLRIFTRKIATDLLIKCGYDIEFLKAINRDLYIPTLNTKERLLYRALSLCFHILIPDFFYLQLLVIAKPKHLNSSINTA
jgi:Methyltransferase domain